MWNAERGKKKKESRVAHWPPNSPCIFYINQLEFFFPLFVFHDEFQTQDEKKYQYRPVFWVTLCVFKHNEGVRLSVSTNLSGGLIKRIPIERVLPMAWKERDETS